MNMPEILYKYKPLNDYTMKIIEDGELYFPSVSELNDPEEQEFPDYDESELTDENVFRKIYDMAKELYPNCSDGDLLLFVKEKQQEGWLFDEENHERTRQFIQDEWIGKCGIFSLTTENDNPLMWEGYAEDYSGICIGFDKYVLQDTVHVIESPVRYYETLPKRGLFDSPEELYMKMLSTKSTDWEYENEYRILKLNAASKTFTIPLEGIVEVIFGCKMSKDDKDELIKIISTNNPKCSMYEVKKNDKTFELDILPIDE
jgi:hypothetical protein